MNSLISAAKQLNIKLSKYQLDQFSLLFDELALWNRTTNLTAINEYEEVLTKHFADSLTTVLGISPQDLYSELKVADIGSGAGFPGLPLKIAFPNLRMTLIETTTKKTVFLEHIIAKLKLDGIEVVTGRAEELGHNPAYREGFNLVVSRAVARLSPLCEYCLPFCTLGGNFIGLKKGDMVTEILQSSKAIEQLGGDLRSVFPVNVTGLNDGRQVIVIEKLRLTPSRYPRRAGIPLKRPI